MLPKEKGSKENDKKPLKKSQEEQKKLTLGDNVPKVSTKRPIEKEKETEKELEPETDKNTHKKECVPKTENPSAEKNMIEFWLRIYAETQETIKAPNVWANAEAKKLLAKGVTAEGAKKLYPVSPMMIEYVMLARKDKQQTKTVNPDDYYNWMEEV